MPPSSLVASVAAMALLVISAIIVVGTDCALTLAAHRTPVVFIALIAFVAFVALVARPRKHWDSAAVVSQQSCMLASGSCFAW